MACILGSGIVFLDGTVVNVALPALRSDLNAGLAEQQWVVEAYMLTLTSLLLVGGSLDDIFERRTVFAAGVVGFGVTSLLCAVAPSVELLIAARALQGVGGRAACAEHARDHHLGLPGGRARRRDRLVDRVDRHLDRDRPARGRPAVDTASWRWIFLINIPLVVVTLYLIARRVPTAAGAPERARRLPRRPPLRARARRHRSSR